MIPTQIGHLCLVWIGLIVTHVFHLLSTTASILLRLFRCPCRCCRYSRCFWIVIGCCWIITRCRRHPRCFWVMVGCSWVISRCGRRHPRSCWILVSRSLRHSRSGRYSRCCWIKINLTLIPILLKLFKVLFSCLGLLIFFISLFFRNLFLVLNLFGNL